MPGSSDVDAQPAATARASVKAAGAPGGAEDALDALTALVADDLEACNRLIVERMQSPVALIPQLAAHIVAAGGKRLRPLLTLAAAQLCGYRGAAARGARGLRGVHPHRHPAARRRGGRERAAPRPGQRQRAVRQQAERAGRRFPLRPRLPADGGGRVAEGAGDPVRRGRDHRRGRGAAARHPERHRDDRGAVPPGDRGQDGGAVRRGDACRRGGGGPAGGRGGGARRLWPQPRHRLPARGRRARLFGGAGAARQDGRRRFPRGQDHPAGAAGASRAAPRSSAASGARRWRGAASRRRATSAAPRS